MRKGMLSCGMRAAAMLLVIVISILAEAGVGGDVELMRLVADGSKANREKIVTWKGTASITSQDSGTAHKKSYEWCRKRMSAAFAYDAQRNAQRYNLRLVEDRSSRDDVEKTKEKLYSWNGLVKKDALYRTGRFVEGVGIRHCHVYNKEDRPLELSDDAFDPMGYFSKMRMDLHVRYEAFKAWVDSPVVDITIRREGDLVIVEHRSHSGNPGVNRYTYDLSKGCNMTGFYSKAADSGPHEWKCEYENVAGVWLPSKVTEDRESMEGADVRKRHMEVVFEHSLVNEPLDEEEFSLAALGLKPGTYISDQRTGLRYQYGLSESGKPTLSSREVDETANSLLEEVATDAEAPRSTEAMVQTTPQPDAPSDEPPAAEESAGRGRAPWGKYVLLGLGLAIVITAVALMRRRKTAARR